MLLLPKPLIFSSVETLKISIFFLEKSIFFRFSRKTCFYNFLHKSIPNEEVVKYAYLNYNAINKWGKNNKFGTIYYYVTNKKIDKLRQLVHKWYISKLSKKKSKSKT